jgi:hypothetical protein
MDAVSECHHAPRGENFNAGGKAAKRGPRIIRRQHHAACCVGRALFQMQIRDEERPFRLPIKRTRSYRHQRLPRKRDGRRQRRGFIGVLKP